MGRSAGCASPGGRCVGDVSPRRDKPCGKRAMQGILLALCRRQVER